MSLLEFRVPSWVIRASLLRNDFIHYDRILIKRERDKENRRNTTRRCGSGPTRVEGVRGIKAVGHSVPLLSNQTSRHYLGFRSSLSPLTDMEATERLARTWIASGREEELVQIASGTRRSNDHGNTLS